MRCGHALLFFVVVGCASPEPQRPLRPLLPPVAAAPAPPPASSTPPSEPPPPDFSEVIARIERGLVPLVRVKGETKGASLEARMRELHVPGLSFAVFTDFRVQWARAYGVADVDTRERVTDATLFQAASISKTINALAVLQLHARGELSIDQPVNQLLKRWTLPDNDFTRQTPVTLRHLLTHMGGTNVHGFLGYAAGAPLPTIVQVLDGLPPANSSAIRVDSAPGKQFRYSGGGITVTQQALVDRLDRPYAAIAQELVLGPLEMTHSSFEQPLPEEKTKTAATGHDREAKPIDGKRNVYPELAAAGLWTTPTDLARLFVDVQRALAGRPSKLTRDVAVELTRPVGKAGPVNQVAHGVFLMPKLGAGYFGHDGANVGFRSLALARFERGYGVVMMANGQNASELFDELFRAIALELGWQGVPREIVRVRLEPAQLAAVRGRYDSPAVLPFDIVVNGDRVELRAPFADAMDLVPIGAGRFVVRANGSLIELDASVGGVRITRMEAGGGTAKRVGDGSTAPLFDLESGRFDVAVAGLRRELATNPRSERYGEAALNALGYQALRGTRGASQALLVFRANVALHPDSPNAHDSLAEAYEVAGDKPKAIAEYKACIASAKRNNALDGQMREAWRKRAEERIAALGKE